jgi:pimeloyl-ACP methyl ester carboxylesterase
MRMCLLSGLVLVVLMALAGCTTPIGATKVSPQTAYQHLNENALNSSHYSAEAGRVLHRYDLDGTFRTNTDAALQQLQAIACQDERRDVLYALSELNYWNARHQSRSVKLGEPRRARDSYFASAVYAYLYLLGEDQEARPSPFDIRFRAASDFYNRGLALGLMVGTNAVVKLAGGPRQTPPGVVDVQLTQPGFPWSLDLVDKYYSADEFIVRGLATRNRDSGLGAPLIVVTKPMGRFQERRRVPATVFLRVSGDVRDWNAGKLTATLELYSVFDVKPVEASGQPVPLQTDTTAPIAQGLNDSQIWSLGVAQFFSAEQKIKTGIRHMEPYSPGQIPVVFVHGTASSPVWWAEMWNTLNADPVLRSHYQFWMFNYASGNPITYTANILRNDLMNEVQSHDPDGKDPAMRQMIIIGHSQGGLLAKLTATDTGDKLWRIVSPTNDIDQLQVDEKTRELLRTNFFFKPLPCVSEVVFIATPHRGSYRNTGFVKGLLTRFMTMSRELKDLSASLLKLNETVQLPPHLRKGVPTSLSGMTTDNPFLLTLADIPTAPGIKAHSIIAIQGNDQPPKGGDGVVSYTSAHVDYAESEFIVRTGHSCQDNPLTIEEVRRILLQHLNASPDPAFSPALAMPPKLPPP